jgi:5-(carboxyamino)imidazole ribonucleotide synthase
MPVRADGPRVGILGGGQLARMLALAGAPLGMRFLQLAPEPAVATGLVDTITAAYTDRAALRELAGRTDVVTYESENVAVEAVDHLATMVPVLPPPRALATAGDRWAEKDLFTELDIPTAPYVRVAGPADLQLGPATTGLPAVVKTRRLGYDGRGQAVCRTVDELNATWERFGGVPLICERWIPFDREISIVAVRSRSGEVRCYPPGENAHEQGILVSTAVPAVHLSDALRATAATYVRRIMEALDYTGVLALEMFQHGDALLANEIAPRVHNTGHWSIEGADCSQFENHLRAILGWPLGSTAARGHVAMLNLIGHTPPLPELLAVEAAHVHVYGKEPRAGRKLGHVTVTAASADELARRVHRLTQVVRSPHGET